MKLKYFMYQQDKTISFVTVNAYICYRDSFVIQQKLNHLKFHQQLCQELIGNFRQGSRNQQFRLIPTEHRALSRLHDRHFRQKYQMADGKNV